MAKLYSKSHEWVEVREGSRARVGVSDYAQKELGDIVFLELPDVGKEFHKAEQFGTIESTKSVSELFLPLAGKIVAVNQAVIDNPALVNQDPEGEGWLVEIEIEDKTQLEELLSPQDYRSFIAQEH